MLVHKSDPEENLLESPLLLSSQAIAGSKRLCTRWPACNESMATALVEYWVAAGNIILLDTGLFDITYEMLAFGDMFESERVIDASIEGYI